MDRPHCGKDGLGAQFVVFSLLAAPARNGPLARGWNWKLHHLAKRCSPGLVQGRAQRPLDRFQIQPPGFVLFAEDATEKPVHFPRDFLMDRNRRLFSSGVQPLSDSIVRC